MNIWKRYRGFFIVEQFWSSVPNIIRGRKLNSLMASKALLAFRTGSDVVAALCQEEPVRVGAALDHLRLLCSIQPISAVIADYLKLEPTADSLLNVLNLARQSNSIHLLANSLYTLSCIISRLSSISSESNQPINLSTIINHLIHNHSKSIHRCFAPGRTEATLACLSLLIACVSWDEGSCSKVVIGDLRWDTKTIARLLNTRQVAVSPHETKTPKSTRNGTQNLKSFKIKGGLRSTDVRTMMLRFIFIITHLPHLHWSHKLEFWRTKGLVDGVLKHLRTDSYEIIAYVLINLWENVVRQDSWAMSKYNLSHEASTLVAKLPAWELLDGKVIEAIAELLDRDDAVKDAPGSSHSFSETIAQMVEKFLTNLVDYIHELFPMNLLQSHSNTRLLQHRILLTLIKSLAPTKSLRRQRIALHILCLAPSCSSTLWRTTAPASEPAATLGWISSVGFATKVASLPISLPHESRHLAVFIEDKGTLTAIANNLLAQCVPTPVTRLWFTRALQHENALVKFSALGLLLSGLKKALSISRQLKVAMGQQEINIDCIGNTKQCVPGQRAAATNHWSTLQSAFHLALQAVLPDPQVLIAALKLAPRRAAGNRVSVASSGCETQEPVETQKHHDGDGTDVDILSFHILAVLLMYHEIMPHLIYCLNFDYAKLIPVFLKVGEEDGHTDLKNTSISSNRHNSAVSYLCQSRILRLITYSAQSNFIPASPNLVKFLLSISCAPPVNRSTPSSFSVPQSIKETAHRTLHAICKSSVPHLRDEYEVKELDLWIYGLAELKRILGDVTNLIAFLDDCLRACLRNPLKYVQMSDERTKLYPLLSGGFRFPILLASLLSKVTNITTAFTSQTINPSRENLISIIIKFLDIYLLKSLTSPHDLRPIILIQHISFEFCQLLKVAFDQQRARHLHLPTYMGPTILSLLISVTQPIIERGSLSQSDISWPSHISQSTLSDQLTALKVMHRLFVALSKQQTATNNKKAVMLIDFSPSDDNVLSTEGRLSLIRFITRSFEVDRFKIKPFIKQDTEVVHVPLGYDDKAKNIKALLDLIAHSLTQDPLLFEGFMQDEALWHVSQQAADQHDYVLLLDIMQIFSSGVPKVRPIEEQAFARYVELLNKALISTLISDPGMPQHFEKSRILLHCVTTLLPVLTNANQCQLLVSILTHAQYSFIRDKCDDFSTLLGAVMKWNTKENQLLLERFLVSPIMEKLLYISQLDHAEAAMELVLVLVEQSLGPNASKNFEIADQIWETYSQQVLQQNLIGLHNVNNKKLKVVTLLVQQNSNIYLAAVQWLAQVPISQFNLPWNGILNLLVACLEISPFDDSSSNLCQFPTTECWDQSRLEELLKKIGSGLLSEQFQADDLASQEARASRISASKAFKLICSRLQLRSKLNVDTFLSHDTTTIGVAPAFVETLNVLREIRSNYLTSYVSRCLLWLVRRFAEDDVLTIDTEALCEGFEQYLSSDFTEGILPVHLVNPILTAALHRWLDCGFVMKLVASLIQFTKLDDTEVLKHVRALAEGRKFRLLMTSANKNEDQAVLVVSILAKLVMNYPAVTIKATLSKSLIPFYGGSMSLKDRLMFQIFRVEDLWSDKSALDEVFLSWKPPTTQISSVAAKPFDFLALLDSDKIDATCVWMMSRLNSQPSPSLSYYDPGFLLSSFLRNIENTPVLIATWLLIARTGMLGLAMCALSSARKSWRFLGDRCLAKSQECLNALNHTDTLDILLPLNHFRRLHSAGENKHAAANTPPLITLFLARSLKVFCSTPESSLYPSMSRFLLHRALIDSADVPMLYSMLYSDNSPTEHHVWLLKVLRDGLHTAADWRIMDFRQTIDILMTLVLSSIHTTSSTLRLLLLQLLRKATSHNQSCVKLVNKSALVHVLKRLQPLSKAECRESLKIMEQIAARLPLFYRETAADAVESIGGLLKTQPMRNQALATPSLAIIRCLLVSAPFWLNASNRFLLIELETLASVLRHRTPCDALIHEIDMRFLYLHQDI
ncbi:hypothetical protein O181_007571 [Austropuccinia psidii MF-1]|uniref:Nucleolar pre-ribosomal-associated protein 1 C-terminal domain-containing protein n=1 Tax=Austropuccinia psidii MF-1 TaxID=1389203 RepID=A0A9Q3BN39_9BASI|nr:hypothetical protein [Austropuccinia psidii MF-1]